jgi:hypothetical protein
VANRFINECVIEDGPIENNEGKIEEEFEEKPKDMVMDLRNMFSGITLDKDEVEEIPTQYNYIMGNKGPIPST